MLGGRMPAPGAAGAWIRSTKKADQTKRPAITMKTTPVEAAASRSPPSAGPRNVPTLSIVLDTAFAAVSSSGVLASDGVNAA